MYDVKIIEYKGKPLFQSAKMASAKNLKSSLRDMACFIYVVKGSGELIESNGTHTINQNEALVKSCGNFISSYLEDNDGNDFETTVIYFYPEIVKEIYGDMDPESLKTHTPRKIIGNQLVEKFIHGLHLYFENEELVDEEILRHKLKELIIILLKSNYFESVVDLFSELFSPKEKTFRQIVENNLFSDISIDQLAFLTHRSLSTFKRDFKKEFDDTPARFIKKSRLEKAAELLRNTDQSISHIAFDCLFQDLSTFSSVFRSHFNASPTEYRLNQMRKALS